MTFEAILMMVAAPAATAAAPVALGPYAIGMSLEEVRAVPLKAVGSEEVTLSCTGEKSPAVYTSDEMRAEGVVECTPARTIYTVSASTAIYFGTIILKPTLRFHQGRLYQIEIRPHTNWLTPYRDALRLKYGKPASEKVAEVSNAFGAKWPQLTSEWRFGTQSVTVIAPNYKRDEFSAVYTDEPVAGRIEAAVRSRKAAGAGI